MHIQKELCQTSKMECLIKKTAFSCGLFLQKNYILNVSQGSECASGILKLFSSHGAKRHTWKIDICHTN